MIESLSLRFVGVTFASYTCSFHSLLTLSPFVTFRAMHDKIYLKRIDFDLKQSYLVSIVTNVIEEEEVAEDENQEEREEREGERSVGDHDHHMKREKERGEYSGSNGERENMRESTMKMSAQEVEEKKEVCSHIHSHIFVTYKLLVCEYEYSEHIYIYID